MTTMKTVRRPPPGAATGSFRWLQKPDADSENGVIAINGTPYLLTPVRTDARLKKDRRVIGYRLTKADCKVYDVYPTPTHWQCDCPDAVYARDKAPAADLRECKHAKVMKLALKVLDGEELPCVAT